MAGSARCARSFPRPGAGSSICILFFVIVASAHLANGEKKRKARRRGDEGTSGLRCSMCQAAAFEGRKSWELAKTTKSGSPYYYMDGGGKEGGGKGESPENMVERFIKKKVCNRAYLNDIPNPKGYAKHLPTVQWECDNFLEEHSSNLVDAFTLGDDIAAFCWDQDICGSEDKLHFDFKSEL